MTTTYATSTRGAAAVHAGTALENLFDEGWWSPAWLAGEANLRDVRCRQARYRRPGWGGQSAYTDHERG
ncbi:MAG: hypothetical protein H6527_00965 [Actinobacteria bacterium]|nr:hypothetical protein [Actinomycetota bacterium]